METGDNVVKIRSKAVISLAGSLEQGLRYRDFV
jgi:hypothetical protein